MLMHLLRCCLSFPSYTSLKTMPNSQWEGTWCWLREWTTVRFWLLSVRDAFRLEKFLGLCAERCEGFRVNSRSSWMMHGEFLLRCDRELGLKVIHAPLLLPISTCPRHRLRQRVKAAPPPFPRKTRRAPARRWKHTLWLQNMQNILHSWKSMHAIQTDLVGLKTQTTVYSVGNTLQVYEKNSGKDAW